MYNEDFMPQTSVNLLDWKNLPRTTLTARTFADWMNLLLTTRTTRTFAGSILFLGLVLK